MQSPRNTTRELPEEVARAADLLGRRWVLAIVYASHGGAIRFNEFKRTIVGITPKTLAQRLEELEQAGILERLVLEGRPPRVEYRLTDAGRRLRALVRALDAKKIAGCALDTIDPEPLPDPHPLRGRENVIINPHAAWYSEQAMVGLQAGAPGEVRRVLAGEWPVNVVNRAVKGKSRAGL